MIGYIVYRCNMAKLDTTIGVRKVYNAEAADPPDTVTPVDSSVTANHIPTQFMYFQSCPGIYSEMDVSDKVVRNDPGTPMCQDLNYRLSSWDPLKRRYNHGAGSFGNHPFYSVIEQ